MARPGKTLGPILGEKLKSTHSDRNGFNTGPKPSEKLGLTNSKRIGFITVFGVFIAAISAPLLLLDIIQLDQLIPFIALFVLFLALVNPRWGVVAMVASLAVTEVLPDLPLVSSFSALLGAVTLVSFLFQVFTRKAVSLHPKMEGNFWIGLVLIAWIFASNPAAALVLGDRVWIWTLLQLWLVAWLARNLITDLSTTKLIAIFFILANLLSVYIVLQQGYVGESIYQSRRGFGLGQGANDAARYFILALLFTYYLYMTKARKKPMQSLFLVACALVITLGVINTVSRTGIILIALAVGLILISPSAKSNGKKLGFLLLGFVGVSYFIPANALRLTGTILSSISVGTDTAGLRYALWAAGMKMFSDSPFTGVGIGQFQFMLPKYGAGIVPVYYLNLTPHNMYVQLLAETGIVGFSLFMAMVILALKNLYLRMLSTDYDQAMTAWMWFSLVVIILVGAFTKTEFTEKLLWVGLGIGFTTIPKVKEVPIL